MSDSPSSPESNPNRFVASRLLQSRALWGIVLVILAAWIGLDQLQRVGGPAELRARWGMSAMVPLILLPQIAEDVRLSELPPLPSLEMFFPWWKGGRERPLETTLPQRRFGEAR